MPGTDLVLGVDPGSNATGYGIIKTLGGGGLKFLEAGVIRTSPRQPFPKRLKTLYDGLLEVISYYRPDCAAFEEVFVAKNVNSALKLGHARAALLMAAINSGLDIYEYSALEVKKAVVGYGRAEKSQVQKMVSLILNINKPLAKDATDALAVALCHIQGATLRSYMEIKVQKG